MCERKDLAAIFPVLCSITSHSIHLSYFQTRREAPLPPLIGTAPLIFDLSPLEAVPGLTGVSRDFRLPLLHIRTKSEVPVWVTFPSAAYVA